MTALQNPPHCVLSLDQVDELQDHTHRIVLVGNVIANALEHQAVEDRLLEGLLALVTQALEDAAGIDAVLERGCQAVQADG